MGGFQEGELRPFVLAAWGVLSVIVLVVGALLLRRERRSYATAGKGRPWLVLRLAWLPIAVVTALVIVMPARRVGGPEALAVFYGSLFTIGPLVYGALHWLVGRMVRPSLSFGESAAIAAGPIAFGIATAMVVGALQGPIFMLALSRAQASYAAAEAAPLPHATSAVRFAMPSGGELLAWSVRAPAGVRTERVDRRTAAGVQPNVWQGTSTWICRDHDDIHVLWPADEPPPDLDVYWRAGDDGALRRSGLAVPPPASATPFEVAWRDDGFALPVRVPRFAVGVARTWGGDGTDVFDQPFTRYASGETFADGCAPLAYARADVPGAAVAILVQRAPMQPIAQERFVRPSSAVAASH